MTVPMDQVPIGPGREYAFRELVGIAWRQFKARGKGDA